ncbi:MAG: ferredoxin--nitrite reductase [Campylobacterota bacterium]|nr:ferredoxin--nitrite reductase [Campylobacterota bacterium]
MSVLQQAFDARNKKQNKIEVTKELKTPKEAYEQLETYAKQGYDAIAKEDLGYFLKCFGIFDRPATPKQFMIRVRIPGGHLNAEQADVIGALARDYGKDYIDITTRMQVELRYLDIENIPRILKRLESVGISSYQTGVDNFRNILNDPLDALAFDNILPSQNLLLKIQSIFLGNHEWISALPRKFNTGITGSIANRSNVFGQDCALVLAQKDGAYGYNLYLGGKVGQIAKSANIFLKDEDEVMAMYNTLISLFRDFGFRDNRNKNRLYFLIEAVGIEAMSAAIRSHAGVDFATAGETMTQIDNNDPDQGRVQLKDGTFAVHVVVPSGIFSGSALIKAAELSREQGSSELRFDVEQSLYILGVKPEEIDALLEDSFFETYKSVNTPYFNHMIACAGTEHCPFGVIPNKPDAIEMSQYLSSMVPLEAGRIRMYWSACVKGCGLHGVGDIGFEGCKAKVNGVNEFGVHISLGGKLTGEGEEGYSVIKAAPLRYAKFYVESLMLEYRRLKMPQESFELFHDRVLTQYTGAYIGFMMKLQAYLRGKSIDINVGFSLHVKSAKEESFEVFELGRELYLELLGNEPYTQYTYCAPTLKEVLQVPKEVDTSIDENLSNMISKMLSTTDEKADKFAELLAYIEL